MPQLPPFPETPASLPADTVKMGDSHAFAEVQLDIPITAPILLLDDIFDKLDANRVEQIVRLVSGEDFGQIFITDTNRDHLDRILALMPGEHHLFHVEGGNVKD